MITNNGTVRILAGANANPLAGPYSPISAAWSGSGICQPIGGTWNATDHTFTASAAQLGSTGTETTINLKSTQRLLIDGLLGASFTPTTTDTLINFTASAISGQPLLDLQSILDSNYQTLLSDWQITSNYDITASNPAYLSFDVGPDISRNDINVWHYDSGAWRPFDATDLTCNGGYASFTVTDFSDYALAVPEPGTLMLLASGLISAFVYFRRRLNNRCIANID